MCVRNRCAARDSARIDARGGVRVKEWSLCGRRRRARAYVLTDGSLFLDSMLDEQRVLRMAGFKSAFYGEHDAYRDVSGHLGGSWIAGTL